MVRTEEVTKWINDGKPYEKGVALFSRYGKNPTLMRIFPGRQDRYADKLEYELCKLAGLPGPVRKLAPSSLPAPDPHLGHVLELEAELSDDDNPHRKNLPEAIITLAKEFITRYKRRGLAHKELKEVGEDNNLKNNSRRLALVEEINGLSLRMDELWPAYNAWRNGREVPDLERYLPGSLSVQEQQETKSRIDNLKKTISKDRLLLEYQSVKKLAAPNPLPHGPRRQELEDRIKAKQAEMDDLKRRINGSAQD